MTANKSHTVVIGAGINGVAAAIWLARAGRQVTLVDRLPPGEGTSHGNAGVLAACSMVPVTAPGLARKAPFLLLDKHFPLFLRWSYLPTLSPWLIRYLSNANDQDTRRIASKLTTIVADSVEQHQELAGNTEADEWLAPSDYQFAYASRAAFDADRYVWSLRRDNGFEPELIEGGAVQEKEPALSSAIGLLAVMKQHGFVRSPGQYVKSLARVAQGLGASLMQASVQDIDLVDGHVHAVQTDQGAVACDSVVLAAGVWSTTLAKKLGISVPMESERGYHVLFKDPSVSVSAPTMIASGKFVATPMADGLRCAGIVELGGLKAGPSKAPLALLMSQVKQTLPTMTWSNTIEWLGHRPAPSDSLPFIGQIRNSGVFTAFGHHHIGLTGGAKTGRLVAGLICGEQSADSLKAYDPMRFSH
ncbi:MAG: FAD-dependent oxidoreductase [Granulosicoccus sp.]|nr:FAD-dependent oxidoreductase [Granulosicoccus sp.]